MIDAIVRNLFASLPETGSEVLLETLDYGNRKTRVVNSNNPLDAVWASRIATSMRVRCAYLSAWIIMMKATSFGACARSRRVGRLSLIRIL